MHEPKIIFNEEVNKIKQNPVFKIFGKISSLSKPSPEEENNQVLSIELIKQIIPPHELESDKDSFEHEEEVNEMLGFIEGTEEEKKLDGVTEMECSDPHILGTA